MAGLPPTLLGWPLANPADAVAIGVISAETAAAVQTGTVSPASVTSGLPPLRLAYVNEVKLLEDVAPNMQAAVCPLIRLLAYFFNCAETLVSNIRI